MVGPRGRSITTGLGRKPVGGCYSAEMRRPAIRSTAHEPMHLFDYRPLSPCWFRDVFLSKQLYWGTPNQLMAYPNQIGQWEPVTISAFTKCGYMVQFDSWAPEWDLEVPQPHRPITRMGLPIAQCFASRRVPLGLTGREMLPPKRSKVSHRFFISLD